MVQGERPSLHHSLLAAKNTLLAAEDRLLDLLTTSLYVLHHDPRSN
jgi:hypothetical protein